MPPPPTRCGTSGVFFSSRVPQVYRDAPPATAHRVMIPPAPFRSLRMAGALLLALGFAALLGGAPLLPVRVTARGRGPGGADARLIAIDGAPLVITNDRIWLGDGAGGWRAQAWRADGWLAAIFGDGRSAFALVAEDPSAPARRVRQLLLPGGQLLERALPPLPSPLHSALGAIKDGRIFVHGWDAGGVPQLFTLVLSEAIPVWHNQPGCA